MQGVFYSILCFCGLGGGGMLRGVLVGWEGEGDGDGGGAWGLYLRPGEVVVRRDEMTKMRVQGTMRFMCKDLCKMSL